LKKPQALIGLLAALGTAIGVLVAVVGLPYGRADYTAFADLYHGTTDTTGTFSVTVDCDAAVGTQLDCDYPIGSLPASVSVNVDFSNATGAAVTVNTFNFTLVDSDDTRFDAAATAVDPLNSNPDFNETSMTGAWACSPPPPDDDLAADVDPNTDESFISCFTSSGNGPTVPNDSSHYTLADVTYNTFAVLGMNTVTLRDVQVFDDAFGEIMSCNPVIGTAGTCTSGTLEIIPDPTATPTVPGPTATPTNTPTNTATATNTVPPTATFTPLSDSGLVKECENGVPLPNGEACNLWICLPDNNAGNDPDCDGPGEGSLHVIERAINVPAVPDAQFPDYNGLGAYEFSVEYDNFVIQSVNPCDIIFGPGGAGAARGPVDEVDSSSPENADCTPDPGIAAPGSCAMSLILENIIHFGCATGGLVQGPNGGDFDLASLELIPHPDLVNDIFPGNNNGVLTVLKDNGCELVDTLGHPIPGSVNGGLTILCRDLAVTVRILEGDLDLDCDVDPTDAQLIASRYGAFFGGLLYNKWYDLEPQFHDLDIDIKDIQKVFGRQDSNCNDPDGAGPLSGPIPAQPPVNFPG
jgi:hypothetical protein